MKRVDLYAYGRSTVQGAWWIDRSKILNRLYFVNSGSAHIITAHSDHLLSAGGAYIIPNGQTFLPQSARDFDHTFFDFYHYPIFHRDNIIELEESTANATGFFDYVNGLIRSDKEKGMRTAMEYALCGFLSALEAQGVAMPYVTNEIVTRAIDLIRRDYAELSTSILAQKLSVDESYFIRLFSSIMGITPMKYIRAYRINRAREFIMGGASIAQASEKCGYSSPSSFYNAVKAELHMPPSRLRGGK